MTWKRALWQQRGFEDNYVDESFLEGLRMNMKVTQFKISDLFRESSCVTQQLSLVVMFVMGFFEAVRDDSSTLWLASICLLVFVFLATVSYYLEEEEKFRYSLTESAVTAGVLLFVSPVLKTLTYPWSDDTLTACCLLLLFIHLAACNYSVHRRDEPVATNAATFSAVLLSSRLQNQMTSYIMITLSVLLFVMSPEPRRDLRRAYPEVSSSITWLLVGSSSAFLLYVNFYVAVLYVVVVVAITFLIPIWFYFEHQSAKMQINGPWDEAKPTNSVAAAEWATAGLLK